jgi:hypothetical protein
MVWREKPGYVQGKHRFPKDLHRRLEAAAERNHRSLNAEIVVRLEGSFRDPSVQRAMEEAREAREARGRVATQEDLNELRQEVFKRLGITKGESSEGTS